MRVKNLLYILKHDRQTAIGLLVVFILVSLICLEFCTSSSKHEKEDYDAEYERYVRREKKAEKYYAVEEKKIHLQAFDPNTADSTVLLGLGLQPWQVRSIYKYRAAGGVYTRPEDFARLYGLSKKKYRELKPYIRIADDYRPASEGIRNANREGYYGNAPTKQDNANNGNGINTGSNATGGQSAGSKKEWQTKLKPGQTIALNSADTTSLQSVPGIGPYYARKIARYRDQLGGFVSKEQLMEIQDFPESTLPYLDIQPNSIRKLNINRASAEQLRKHPYITFAMARQIMDYRRLRGNIRDLNDLSLLPNFTKETINKLRPYIEY